MKSALLFILVGIVLAGCVTTAAMDAPKGFAQYANADLYRVVSPDGVVLRVRIEANRPVQTLEFWARALSSHLSDSGYELLEDATFQSNAGDGHWFEWLAPVAEDDWIYLTALVVTDEEIIVIESAGPVDRYRQYRQAIKDQLDSVTVHRGLR